LKLIREFPSRVIDRFGSVGFVHSRLARGEIQVSLAELGPGGRIGGHPAVSRQLFVVLRGRGWVRTESENAELAAGEAALWETGEWHESGTDEGMSVLVVEGELETF
jgi:quercetin dioxygenase-like cupin family protein